MTLVEMEGVSVRYARDRADALSEVSLSLSGGIVGLIGPNGAGKSTLLKLLLGVVKPSAGSVRISGLPPDLFRLRMGGGFIPERPIFPSYLQVGEFLRWLTVLTGSPPLPREWMERLGVEALSGFRLDGLSLGQKRRVELAAALLGDPPLLLLDEPTNGLDPLVLTEFRSLVTAARRDDRLILISSHHLDELQRVADRVVMLNEGKLEGSWGAQEVADESGSFHEHFLRIVGNHAH